MTRFIHDQFAKDYLETLLEPFGTVRTPRRVAAEAQQIDVWFEPTRTSLAGLSELGCLGRMAATSSIFEPCLECVLHSGGAACGIAFRTLKAPWENPLGALSNAEEILTSSPSAASLRSAWVAPELRTRFRNPVTTDKIGDCLLKWLLVKGESKRQAKRNRTVFSLEAVPKLWILTPTASSTLLSGVHAVPNSSEVQGFYTLAPAWKTTIIAIHQLPRQPETLWLRVLGREQVQREAIDELETLSPDNPFRQQALELLYTLRKNLELKQEIEPEDQELIMRLAPLYQQEREQLEKEAEERGMAIAQRKFARNLLSRGMDVKEVAELTGLSMEEVTQLSNESLE